MKRLYSAKSRCGLFFAAARRWLRPASGKGVKFTDGILYL